MASRRSVFSLLSSTVSRPSKLPSWKAQSSFLDSFAPLQTRSGTTDSTSALAYKAVHRRSPLPLPVSDSQPTYGAAAAVSSILYETPAVSQAPATKHILNCLVQNEPGVLSRISGILAARGFNIDSLVVCSTEVSDLSRMTIVLQGLDGVVEQARRQLEDLVPVWAVLDYTSAALVQRELLLAKISIMGPEVYEELMEHHREMTSSEGEPTQEQRQLDEENSEKRLQELEDESTEKTKKGGLIQSVRDALGQSEMASRDYHPSRLAASQALRHKHEHLEAITHLAHQFGGKVLDISTNNCIVEV